MRLSRYLAITLWVVCGSGVASAQIASELRYNEGPGIKISEGLVFHPGFAAEMRYDTNVLAINDNTAGAPFMRLIGHIHLATLSQQRLSNANGQVVLPKVEFRLKAALGYREYFSDDDAVVSQRALDVQAGLNVVLFPRRMFSFEINDDFTRVISPRNFFVATPNGNRPTGTLNQDMNYLTALVHFRPGGGRLELKAGYAVNFMLFESSEFNFYNKIFHGIVFRGKYRFLPKSAITLDVTQMFYDYFEAQPAGLTNNNSSPLRILAGYTGLVTPKLKAILQGGVGVALYSGTGTSYTNFLARAELAYRFSPLANLRVGYRRLFEDALLGNFYSDDNIYIQYDHLLLRRLALMIRPSYTFRQYDGFEAVQSVGVTAFDAHLLQIATELTWNFTSWFYVGGGYELQFRDVNVAAASTQVFGIVDFTKHQVYAKVGVSY